MFIVRWLKAFWHVLDVVFSTAQRVIWRLFQLLILAGAAVGLVLAFTAGKTDNHYNVLVLAPEGQIVELPTQRSVILELIDKEAEDETTSLHHLLKALNDASSDPAVNGIVLKLDKLDQAGLATIRELGTAIDRFKEGGKPVWAWGTNFTQTQYAIAAHANEIYMHPMGMVEVKGLASNRLYFGELFNQLGLKIHVFKAGVYKSYPERFTESAPSKEWLSNEIAWLNDAWAMMASRMETSRGLMPLSVTQYIEDLPALLKAEEGHMAKTALNAHLIDGLKTEDEMVAYIESKLEKSGEKQMYPISHKAYTQLAQMPLTRPGVGVIVAEGTIEEGTSDIGVIGAETVIDQINLARTDPQVAAIILRINSPGGSAVASELIRDAVAATNKAGKPVVISVGDTAASGGYWISLGGAKIVASPTSITGSIGVFGLLPTFENALKSVHLGQGGVATTWLADVQNPTKPLDPRLEAILNLNVARTYADFTRLVTQSRGIGGEALESVAQGRVWTGNQSYQHRLVDQLGNFNDAVVLARELAQLPKDAPVTFYIDTEEKLSDLLGAKVSRFSKPFSQALTRATGVDASTFTNFFTRAVIAHPTQAYAHSLINFQQ